MVTDAPCVGVRVWGYEWSWVFFSVINRKVMCCKVYQCILVIKSREKSPLSKSIFLHTRWIRYPFLKRGNGALTLHLATDVPRPLPDGTAVSSMFIDV